LLLTTLDASSDVQTTYHGIILEDAVEGSEVKLDKQLTVHDRGDLGNDEICSYSVYSDHSDDFPFHIIEVDGRSGSAKIVVAPGFRLDYEKKREYSFEVAAKDCRDQHHAAREVVHIEVEDINEYPPVWSQSQPSYSADAVEGRVYDYLIHLEAVDKDGIDGISQVCNYRILTPNIPFEIDNDGYLRNTKPLDYNVKSQYLIDVKAEDCSGRSSDKTGVVINVKPLCRSSWTGVSERVEFVPHESRRMLMEDAKLELCDHPCNFTELSVSVQLSTDHIGKGCDRDTYSLQSQRRLCGASDSSVDLLPNPTFGNWTRSLHTDDGLESDQIFAFDGRTSAIEIPSSVVDSTLGSTFSISTWMKHDDTEESNKEHILCNSDGEGKNRHHYSIFVHHCHLVMLLRHEPEPDSTDSVLRPAEWRWRLPEVCDGSWHHYTINVHLPDAVLYIDGREFIVSERNPEIVDDWSLRTSKRVHSTKLVVGACWHGGKQSMGQHFKGYLAGLSILKNTTESDSIIQCLNACQEKLEIDVIDTNDGTSVSINSERTLITLSGTHLNSIEQLLRRISYVNTRTFPTPGHRPVDVKTNAVCAGTGKLDVDEKKIFVVVANADKPSITISGVKHQDVTQHDLSHGVKLFPDLHIDARTKNEESEMKSTSFVAGDNTDRLRDRFRLDSCLIRVDPQLSLSIEHLRYPENLIGQLGLDVDFSEDGLVIAGADKLSSYEEVLHGIRYVNSQSQELNSRTFVVSCTELNGRFTSNLHETTLIVVRTEPVPAPAHVALSVNHIEQPQIIAKSVDSHKTLDGKSQSGIGVAAVIVACVGFVILLMALGIARIRNAKRFSHGAGPAGDVPGVSEDKPEMEWDNSALTITVNPMEQEVMFDDELMSGMHGGLVRDGGHVDSDSEDEEPSSSIQNADLIDSSEEDEDDEIDRGQVNRRRELEWDDSTLSF